MHACANVENVRLRAAEAYEQSNVDNVHRHNMYHPEGFSLSKRFYVKLEGKWNPNG